MKIAKNMEAIFLVSLALVTGMGFANASAPARHAAHIASAAAPAPSAADQNMTVVTVSAKRLSPAEKAQLGN